MYRQHFGLSAHPFDKAATDLWEDGAMNPLRERFNWLLQSPGLGLLYGEPGVGKTSAIRKLSQSLNPHQYQVIYTAETDFGRTDLYRSLGLHFGLEPHYRRANMWRDLKGAIQEKVETQNRLPVWILGRVEHWRAHFRTVGGSPARFRLRPQSDLLGHVSSTRLFKRSVRISRTALTCRLPVKLYVACWSGSAFEPSFDQPGIH